MTTTEIYYGKGYKKGKRDLLERVAGVMDEMASVIGKRNRYYSKEWNNGFDDGIRAFYAELELVLREEYERKGDANESNNRDKQHTKR